MIDTHCHLTFPQLADQLDSVLARAKQAGVDRMINVGTTPEDSQQAAQLTRTHPQIYATAGVHPHYADRVTDRESMQRILSDLIGQPKVVGFGEMGLDRHYPDPPIDEQKRVFDWQLELGAKTTHPIVIHNRKATDEVIFMIRRSGIPGERFVFHCFTGSEAELDLILDLGAMVSFTGIVTFKKNDALHRCLKKVPIDRLMIETDAPYLTPEPHRKVRPNQPCYVADVARFIADYLGIESQTFIETVDRNAIRFFGLG